MKSLQINRVTKRFIKRNSWGLASRTQNPPVLQDFSLEMTPGEVVALVGENGVGKTTVLKLAFGMCRPDRGEVWLGDLPVARYPRRDMGVMLTHRMLYQGLTGLQNLRYTAALYGSKSIGSSVEKITEAWGIGPYLHRTVEELSQGQRTRLALARATLSEPRYLFLDEPFAFLDEASTHRAIELIRVLGATTLLTAPNKESAKFADRIVELGMA